MTVLPPSAGINPLRHEGLAVIDLDSATITWINDRGLALLELSPQRLPESLHTFLEAPDRARFVDEVLPRARSGASWSGVLSLRSHLGDETPWPAMVVPHHDGSLASEPITHATLLFATVDVVESLAMAPDPLTGMATRSALFHRLRLALARNRDNARLLALYFIDLDGLKAVNDRYGHEAGDIVLVETAQRIAARVPASALAVRFGGDEFVVLYEDALDLDEVQEIGTAILDALDRPDDYLALSASMGIAVSRSGEVDSEELVRRADTAMYRAKGRGGSQSAIFDAEMLDEQRAGESLRATLLQATSDNGFSVAAQPIFELATGRIIAVELFIRVRDDTAYLANANQLFRLAHELGEAFDAAVLGRSLSLASVWAAGSKTAPRVHVNVSAQTLVGSLVTDRVRSALESGRVRRGAVAFEVDSGDLGSAGDRERRTVTLLHELGAPIVVDGFGSGALAIGDVPGWNPAMAKIDAAQPTPAALRSLVRAASALGVATCVKGIETQDQLEVAVGAGAYAGQGNALAAVATLEAVDQLLHATARLGF